jgi:hypothetical protein
MKTRALNNYNRRINRKRRQGGIKMQNNSTISKARDQSNREDAKQSNN